MKIDFKEFSNAFFLFHILDILVWRYETNVFLTSC